MQRGAQPQDWIAGGSLTPRGSCPAQHHASNPLITQTQSASCVETACRASRARGCCPAQSCTPNQTIPDSRLSQIPCSAHQLGVAVQHGLVREGHVAAGRRWGQVSNGSVCQCACVVTTPCLVRLPGDGRHLAPGAWPGTSRAHSPQPNLWPQRKLVMPRTGSCRAHRWRWR